MFPFPLHCVAEEMPSACLEKHGGSAGQEARADKSLPMHELFY